MGKIGQLLGNIKIKGDKPLWIIVLILTLFSIIIVYSSSYAETVSDGGSATKLLLEQVFFVVLGWTALIVCYYIPPYIYKKFSYFIFIFCCGLLLYAIIFGATKNGTSRWITIMHVSFQPSEFAKIGLVLYLASIIDRFDLDNFKTYVKTVLIPVGFMLFIILVNSVSMTVLLTLVAASLLLFNGLKGKYILRTLGIAAVLLGLAAGTVAIANNVFDKDIRIFQRFETAGARIERFVSSNRADDDPDREKTKEELREEEKNKDKQFQREMSLIAIKSGGLFGKGPGHSTQKHVLPQANSDFVYSIIIEEYGMIFGIFILTLYVTIFIRCVRISRKCTRKFSAVTVIGLGTAITLQASVHMLVNVGLMPVTGQTLPLLSSGGTSLIVMCAAFGIILSVSKAADQQNLSRKKKQEELPIEIEEAPASEETEEIRENKEIKEEK